jgi:PTS system cellobiose-specific IIC component
MEQKMLPVLSRVAGQRHMNAIRFGMLKAVPFFVIGSFALIIATPPIASWAAAVAPYKAMILLAFNVTFDLISMWVAFSIAAALAESYDYDTTSVGLTSLMAFVLLSGNIEGGVIQMANLGGTGMFAAVLVGLVVPEIFHLLNRFGLVIKLPDTVPDSVKRMFQSFTAVGVVLFLSWIIRGPLNIDLPNIIINTLRPLVYAADTYWAMLLANILMQLLWSVGIHGNAVVFWGVLAPFLNSNLAANAVAFNNGLPPPHIFTEPMEWFIILGGVGCTLPLAFMLLRSKSAHLKSIGKVAIIPSLFFINEPITYGIPIILNPFLVIPFILTHLILGSVTWFAMTVHLVQRTVVMPPWFTVPPPIYQWLSTAGDMRAVVLVVINFLLSALIWYPFFKMYEKKCLAEESAKANKLNGAA